MDPVVPARVSVIASAVADVASLPAAGTLVNGGTPATFSSSAKSLPVICRRWPIPKRPHRRPRPSRRSRADCSRDLDAWTSFNLAEEGSPRQFLLKTARINFFDKRAQLKKNYKHIYRYCVTAYPVLGDVVTSSVL